MQRHRAAVIFAVPPVAGIEEGFRRQALGKHHVMPREFDMKIGDLVRWLLGNR